MRPGPQAAAAELRRQLAALGEAFGSAAGSDCSGQDISASRDSDGEGYAPNKGGRLLWTAVLLLRDGRNEAAWTGRIAPAMRAGWTPRGVRRNRLRLRQVGSGLGVRSCQQAAAAGVLERHSLSHAQFN